MRSSKRNQNLERIARRLVFAVAIPAALLVLPSCGSPPSAALEPLPTRAPGARVYFEYTTVDGKKLSSESLLGRYSVIGLVTTYDVASQALSRFLGDLLRRHKPRINAALLVLEAPENKPLVEAFASALRVSYPVALADAATIEGRGPFVGLHHVPSVVVLDREGREVWRRLGLTDDVAIEAALQRLERGEAPEPSAALR